MGENNLRNDLGATPPGRKKNNNYLYIQTEYMQLINFHACNKTNRKQRFMSKNENATYSVHLHNVNLTLHKTLT